MRTIVLPRIGTATAWRDAARAALNCGLPPDQLVWTRGGETRDLFADGGSAGAGGPAGDGGYGGMGGSGGQPQPAGAGPRVPKAFLELADLVVWHADPARFARLYALLWRVRSGPLVVSDRGDPEVARLQQMAKAVRRDMHKMRAFVRFREVGEPRDGRRQFAAWFEPSQYTLEPNAGFFARRFGDMDWSIFTPDLSAHCRAGKLEFAEGRAKPPLPEDATEELWATYFRNIFNPARLKVQAMRAEMPKKYWKNLPEAAAIPELIASATARAEQMRASAPTLPSPRVEKWLARRPSQAPAQVAGLDALAASLQTCRRCPLHCGATQAVPGEGPSRAPLMVVGEQPGDQEDLAGRPFVGPAGQMFDRLAREAGLDRSQAFVTNAVKHFKYVAQGKRRLHQTPTAGEISHCRWWLEQERALVRPKLILALGASAALALTGKGAGLTARRGTVEPGPDGTPVLLALHPSYLLRLRDAAQRQAATETFRSDLRRAVDLLQAA